MSLRLRTLDTFDDPDAALRAYFGADAAAFGWPRDPAQIRAKRALVDPQRYLLAEWLGEPVGGTGSYALELTLPGGATVSAAGTSDVGVAPTHRRLGVATELMRSQLRSLAEDGTPVAVLHASEGGIYRRFGYGPCTRWRQVRVDARRTRFRPDCPDPGGTLHVLQRDDASEVCAEVHDAVRRHVPGGLSRPASWWPVVLGDTDVYLGGTAGHLVMVHRDEHGHPDGYAIYKVDHDWSRGQANHDLSVWELVGRSPAVELSLWRALIAHDLVATVTGPIAVDHPLFDVVVDGRQVGLDWDQDLLWARPLDVPGLLSARRYGASGRVVISVVDPLLPGLGGTFELSADDSGEGSCRRSDEEPEAEMDMAALGSLLLGATSWRRLARAGQVGTVGPEPLAVADAMFATARPPWCWVRF